MICIYVYNELSGVCLPPSFSYSANFKTTHPAIIQMIATIFIQLILSPKYANPIMQVNIVPIPLQIAYAVDKSMRFNAKGKTTNDNPYATYINIVGSTFVNPSLSFIAVVPPTSNIIAIKERANICIYYRHHRVMTRLSDLSIKRILLHY